MGFEYATVTRGNCGAFHFAHQHDNYNHTHCENRTCDRTAGDHHHNLFAVQPLLFGDNFAAPGTSDDFLNGYGDTDHHQPTLNDYVEGYTDDLNDPAYD